MTYKLRLYAAGATHPGLRRLQNEDAFAIVDGCQLLIVADGVGGRPAGEIASRLAVDAVRDVMTASQMMRPEAAGAAPVALHVRLLEAVHRANLRVREAARQDALLEGMATTLVAVAVEAAELVVVSVGDSRAYRLRDGRLLQLTTDHRSESDHVTRARLSPGALAKLRPGFLTRAIGLDARMEPDGLRLDLRAGDTILLSTDGLTAVVDDGEIAAVLDAYHDPGAAVATLIDRSNQRGGPDNTTCIVGRWAP
jgi:protein phosphatase